MQAPSVYKYVHEVAFFLSFFLRAYFSRLLFQDFFMPDNMIKFGWRIEGVSVVWCERETLSVEVTSCHHCLQLRVE